jgi:Gpi18-like mannosyltransferase
MVSTTTTRSKMSATSYETAQAALVRWGALMLSIYVIYLLIFPLSPSIYQEDRVLEIEQMLRHGRKWFAPLYVLGLLTLFYAFWQVLKTVHSLSRDDPEAANSMRPWVLGIGALCSVTLIGLYPITALDVVLYVVRARLWALYEASPMLALPAHFPQDPYIRFAGEFTREPSPYGPLWELLAQIPVRLGILDIASGVISMKVLSLLSYIGIAILIGWQTRQDTRRYGISGLTAMTFFALNPLVLLEGIGNGHNDMVMLAFMTLGLVLWQRDKWVWAAFAFTFATLIKVSGIVLMPLFWVAVLAIAPDWRTRVKRGLGIAAIFGFTAAIAYRITGPFPEVFMGAQHALFDRWGYTLAYTIRVIGREMYQNEGVLKDFIANATHFLFALYFMYLLIKVAQRKMTLIQAGFLTYFSQLLLGTTFRIWYPLWLIPFAALGLNSQTYWRTFLFSVTAELSIVMYLIIWRWKLDSWEWGLNGPLKQYWDYWTIMTVLTAPWVFAIPLIGPLLIKRKNSRRFGSTLWI